MTSERDTEGTASSTPKNEASGSERSPEQPQPNERATINWEDDPHNPWNWPTWKKVLQVVMLSSSAFLASIGTSIITPARSQIMEEFGVSSTVAILPLTLYVLALGFGPVVGGPLSETWGRYPVYVSSTPLGALFAMGAGFTHSFGALCLLRFLSGFCWAPVLATAAGSLSDTFPPPTRGPASAIFIMMPFLGPGLGPVIGSYVVTGKDWRWTQWTLAFFATLSIIITFCSEETFHPTIKRRLYKESGRYAAKSSTLADRLRTFVVIALIRPIRMLFVEPIVGFICLFTSVGFGILFSFFAAVPYTFSKVYHFSLRDSGLVFLSIVIGSCLGLITIMLCDVLLYRKQIPKYAANQVPPEHRLYPAVIGSIGLPLGLFWFAWTARDDVLWISPAAAIIPFSWGNICLFVSTIQYMGDTYHGSVVASTASASTLARYGFAGVFPLFTIQMYERLGIGWATSVLGFVTLALLPIPWVLFKFGAQIRKRSQYETVLYE